MDNENKPQFSDIIFYTTSEGKLKIEVFYENETFWLSQKRLAELFGVDRSVITKHLKNIYESGELDENSTCAKIAQVQTEGNRQVTREVEFYNLDAVIAVGYRVNSQKATQFRIWATNTLKEFIIKGFVLDDERLKQGPKFGKDYFVDLIERIRDIRTSEDGFIKKLPIFSYYRLIMIRIPPLLRIFLRLFKINYIGQ